MKVVVDTNVFVSGIFWSGPPGRILDAWRHGEISVFLSETIVGEYQRVLRLMADKVRHLDVDPILLGFVTTASLVATGPTRQRYCEDPDDDKFVQCALTVSGAVIVSGDQHLLRVSGKFGVPVMTPAAFVRKYLD